MTNDEAISILTSLQEPEAWEPQVTEKVFTALQMAISALHELKNRNQEIKNSNDPIRRQDAIRIVDGIDTWQAGWRGNAIESMKALPSAQSERKTGKWIRITQGAMPEQYICPFCNRTVESYGVEELLSIRYPYCHCGADMRGEHEQTD